jgi:hypothetical protein
VRRVDGRQVAGPGGWQEELRERPPTTTNHGGTMSSFNNRLNSKKCKLRRNKRLMTPEDPEER